MKILNRIFFVLILLLFPIHSMADEWLKGAQDSYDHSVSGLQKEKSTNVSKYSIHDLPDLPKKYLKQGVWLHRALTDLTQTNRPDKRILQREPSSPTLTPHCPSKSTYHRKNYFTRVTYPRVTCDPITSPDSTMQVFLEQQKEPKENNEGLLSTQSRKQFYKLTYYKGVKLKVPYFCTVHSGPWSAHVVETGLCNPGCGPGESDAQWVLYVLGLPEASTAWIGEWEDIMEYKATNLTVFLNDLEHYIDPQQPQEEFCCSGFHRCFGPNALPGCIPERISCGERQ